MEPTQGNSAQSEKQNLDHTEPEAASVCFTRWYTVIHGCSTNVCLPHLSESMASERNRTGNIAPRKSEIYMHLGHVLGYGYCHRPGGMSLLSNTGARDLMVCFLCVLLTQKLGDFFKIAICENFPLLVSPGPNSRTIFF